MTTLLLCNGEPPGRRLIRRMRKQADRLVAADGGANAARALGIRPDLILGDLDSVTPHTRRVFRDVPTVRVARQDNTDLEKVLDRCVEDGDGRVIIAGATGRRIDMTLANLAVCWHYVGALDIRIVGEDWFAVPVTGAWSFTAPPGTTVSLIPYGRCTGVTLRGLRYPLIDGTLAPGDVAVSNVMRGERCRVEVGRGRVLVIVMTAPWEGTAVRSRRVRRT